MNIQTVVLLMAVLAVGSIGTTTQALALSTNVPLDIETDATTYDHNSIIVVSGHVDTLRNGAPVTLIVTGDMGVVTIEQVSPSSDGSFSVNINTASPLMKYDGEYKIRATYGDNSINDVIFVNLEGGEVRKDMTHSEHHEVREAVDLTNELNYNISGGMVSSITSTNDDSLLVSIHMAEDDGELTITLSEDIITPFNDGSFFVLVNGEESDDAHQMGDQLMIPFDSTTTDIEIVGTHVVPEFGTIAMIVLAVAIVSIIAVSAKSRLSIMPRI